MHVDLFDPVIGLFREMNDKFRDAFEHCIENVIDGITLHTLSVNDHCLFLMLHCVKHFMNIGFGIRQVCDLTVFCNTYGRDIDFQWVWQQVSDLGYGVFMLNLLKIGSSYLGLKEENISYPPFFTGRDIHMEALLKDILQSGIFGKHSEDQTRTCSLTLQAVMADRRHHQINFSNYRLIRTIFPGREYMDNNYCYSRKSPFLLPVAWLHRIVAYVVLVKNPGQIFRKAGRSIAIGRKRIELLEEYKIIGI